MQRIVCRYNRDISLSAWNQSQVRICWSEAIATAGLELDEKRGMIFGPTLPTGASSDAERIALNLLTLTEPSQLMERINQVLPAAIQISCAWVATPGCEDENPARLDESDYELRWSAAPSVSELFTRIADISRQTTLPFIREREHKTQKFDARPLIINLTPALGKGPIHLTLRNGEQGNLRPEEIFSLLGYMPEADTVQIHRTELRISSWHEAQKLRRLGRD